MRVVIPQPLDFALIERRVIENNMGHGGTQFEAEVQVEGNQITLPATGQSFPLTADANLPQGLGRHRFQVLRTEEATQLKPIP